RPQTRLWALSLPNHGTILLTNSHTFRDDAERAGGAHRAFQRRSTMLLGVRVSRKLHRRGLAVILVLGMAGLAGWWLGRRAGEPGKKAARKAAAKHLTLEQSLKKARAGGKYEMLLRQIKVPKDVDSYSAFHDLGFRDRKEYAGHKDLPAGRWVYVAPYW